MRPLAVDDSGAIFDSYAQDTEVTRWVVWRPHRDRTETDAYIAACLAVPPEVARVYVMVGRQDHAVLGAFHLRRPARHRLDVGYVLARPWWGQGLMTEALNEVVTWALDQPGIFRIGAVCDVENIGSARVMEKAGMVREGLLRRWIIHPNTGDEPRDCFIYARSL